VWITEQRGGDGDKLVPDDRNVDHHNHTQQKKKPKDDEEFGPRLKTKRPLPRVDKQEIEHCRIYQIPAL
jgi:hypothetical protein